MVDLHEIRAQVAQLIRAAGDMIRKTSASPSHEKWGHYNFVTETDVTVQDFLKPRLMSLLPGCRFFAEEQENEEMADDFTWVVDPVDGTCNFMRGRSASCVSIALMQGKQPVLAMIYQPYLDELFSALKGEGAFLNDKAIHVSDQPFEKALAAIGTAPYYAELADATAFCFQQFLTRGGDIRRVGSAALDCCDVACGRADLFCELRLSPWDFAAGALLIEEAGGIFTMPYEGKVDFSKPASVLAANPACMQTAMEIVLKSKEYVK